jgi:putative flavoprotein involved in K+ transport
VAGPARCGSRLAVRRRSSRGRCWESRPRSPRSAWSASHRRSATLTAGLERRLFAAGLAAYGLPQSGNRVFTRHLEDGRIPILDIGFRDAVRAYRLRIVPAVEAVQDGRVTLRGGVTLTPDAVVAATGYRPDLGSLVGNLGVLDERGLPVPGDGETAAGRPGLYFAGYKNPLTGALRELRFEAPAIADAVAADSR